MLKKIMSIVIIICITCFLGFCNATTITKSYKNQNVTIKYPYFDNEAIDNLVMKTYISAINENATQENNLENLNCDGLELDLNYKITFENENILSIVFYGLKYREGDAHPQNIIKSVNINKINMHEIKLSDIFMISNKRGKLNDNIFKYGKMPSDIEFMASEMDEREYSDILSYMYEISVDAVSESQFYYITKSDIVFGIETIHADGDYICVSVDSSKIDRFFTQNFTELK